MAGKRLRVKDSEGACYIIIFHPQSFTCISNQKSFGQAAKKLLRPWTWNESLLGGLRSHG
jgi:hypothetical protein